MPTDPKRAPISPEVLNGHKPYCMCFWCWSGQQVPATGVRPKLTEEREPEPKDNIEGELLPPTDGDGGAAERS